VLNEKAQKNLQNSRILLRRFDMSSAQYDHLLNNKKMVCVLHNATLNQKIANLLRNTLVICIQHAFEALFSLEIA